MISSFRNFAKTKFAGLLVFIMIIPFVFWGMGSMFSSGNTNNLAKINNTNISTQEFIDFLNSSGIPQQSIKDNLNNNIIEELLSNLISTTLLELEIKDFEIIITENTLLKKIKENKNFHDDNGNFQRLKYEKFLLENNISAPIFEKRLKNRESQKNLFDYIGAGTKSPKFLVEKLFEEENKKLGVEFINLQSFYKDTKNISDQEIKKFINENNDTLKVEYLDFSYAIINPKNLIGIDEFNQAFFDKIDQIEIEISNETPFNEIVNNFNIKPTNITDFIFSSDKSEIEKKIFELKDNKFDLFENKNDYVLYVINKVDERSPDLKNTETKKEVIELISQKNKFDFNKDLLNKINSKKFNEDEFINMGKNKIESIQLSSIKDNKKFEIDSVKILYSLPINSFTLISDEKNNIYLAKIKSSEIKKVDNNNEDYVQYLNKQNTNNKNSILSTYDIFLNDKYNVELNQKTLERVKNFFQ